LPSFFRAGNPLDIPLRIAVTALSKSKNHALHRRSNIGNYVIGLDLLCQSRL